MLFYSTAAEVPVRNDAAEALIRFANSGGDIGLASVFFCNSGSEANENALKVAAKLTGRHRFAAFDGGWHGRGTLPLSVTDDPKISEPYAPFLAPCTRLPWNDEDAISRFDFSETAAVILEPIQSMSGVREAASGFLQKLRAATAAAGTLLIFDEIQTGVGRLGHPFAAARSGIRPDLLTSAKGLASGVPMGALLMTEAIASRLTTGDLGSTFGGSPLACAALLATLEVIAEERLMERAARSRGENSRSLARLLRGGNSRCRTAPRPASAGQGEGVETTSRTSGHPRWRQQRSGDPAFDAAAQSSATPPSPLSPSRCMVSPNE